MSETPSNPHSFHGWAQYPDFCAECRANRAEEDADREREHDGAIRRLVADFTDQARDAERRVHTLRATVAELAGSQVYDIEIAESSAGTDALAELDTALRCLRNVGRIAEWRAALEKATEPGKVTS